MVRAEVVRRDVREDKVLRGDGTACEASQESELAGVCHGVGERPLKKNLGRNAAKLCASFQMSRKIRNYLMKMFDGRREVRKERRLVGTANEEGARVAEDAVHVPDKLMRSPHLVTCSKVRELRRSVAQGLLGAISESGEKVFEKGLFVVHRGLLPDASPWRRSGLGLCDQLFEFAFDVGARAHHLGGEDAVGVDGEVVGDGIDVEEIA